MTSVLELLFNPFLAGFNLVSVGFYIVLLGCIVGALKEGK